MTFSTMKITTVLALAASVAQVSAHGFVKNIEVDGKAFEGFDVGQDPFKPGGPPPKIGWITTASDIGFVDGNVYDKPDIICHKEAKNGQLVAPVAAGGQVVVTWNTWPDSHHGPITNMLADCKGDCKTVDKTTLEFFKIQEKGLIDGTKAPGKWASDELMANGLKETITIPATLAPGQYVLRHEIIALHAAGDNNGAQHYPQCINLEVTGSGTEKPAGVLGTALYKNTDPGIKFVIYKDNLSYTIPGPPLAFGAAGATPASPGNNGTTAAEPAAPAKPPQTTLATAVRPAATPAPGGDTKKEDECPK